MIWFSISVDGGVLKSFHFGLITGINISCSKNGLSISWGFLFKDSYGIIFGLSDDTGQMW